LTPYAFKACQLGVWLDVEGYGEGSTNEFKEKVNNLDSSLQNFDIKIELKYKAYERKGIKRYVSTFNLGPVVKKFVTEEQ
jgi:hypothetical protein